MDYLMLVSGLIMLIIGGDLLVRGSVGLAERLGVSPFLSGIVVVGFGTSAPELSVSLNAISNQNSAMALGNIIGSNIGNIALIIGVCALISPLKVKVDALKRDVLTMLAAVGLLVLLGLNGQFSIFAGVTLIAALASYLLITYRVEYKSQLLSKQTHQAQAKEIKSHPKQFIMVSIFAIAGLALLLFGSQTFLKGAISLASFFNIPESLVGLTLVAIGTSLPEFTISVVAVLRKHTDVAIGNVIGSNIFNILGILGVTSLVAPISFEGRFVQLDQWVLVGFTACLAAFILLNKTMGRVFALFILAAYVIYTYVGYVMF